MIDKQGRWYTVISAFNKEIHIVISNSWDGWAQNGKRKFIGFFESKIGLTHFVFWRLMISWINTSDFIKKFNTN